ncbi:hypothetical protein KY290_013519 [Solanum tuberosum]|uniref:Uncharacterized protein n=1 Tax=Solanum tuberosum TaxID=4113 RepID=A0ABQ7VM75_SOLTU|nr:hypothetical protein KY289_013629 [Solanum tuberosum]KAH0716951.1 hypothetical protein KY285_012982 [Solanum tuberosum]KAH0769538.1 hypothetical protein KY290_013519 [Solanum tuberosum]
MVAIGLNGLRKTTGLTSQNKVEKHEGYSMRSPKGPIHPLKKRSPGYATKKRKIDEQDPTFGPFAEGTTLLGSTYIPSPAKLLLWGTTDTSPPIMTNSLPTGLGESSSTSSSTHSIISTLVQDQQILKYMMTKMVRRQKKMREHEKKKSKFLNKMMSTLRKFCGLGDEADDDFLSDLDSSYDD